MCKWLKWLAICTNFRIQNRSKSPSFSTEKSSYTQGTDPELDKSTVPKVSWSFMSTTQLQDQKSICFIIFRCRIRKLFPFFVVWKYTIFSSMLFVGNSYIPQNRIFGRFKERLAQINNCKASTGWEFFSQCWLFLN